MVSCKETHFRFVFEEKEDTRITGGGRGRATEQITSVPDPSSSILN